MAKRTTNAKANVFGGGLEAGSFLAIVLIPHCSFSLILFASYSRSARKGQAPPASRPAKTEEEDEYIHFNLKYSHTQHSCLEKETHG